MFEKYKAERARIEAEIKGLSPAEQKAHVRQKLFKMPQLWIAFVLGIIIYILLKITLG